MKKEGIHFSKVTILEWYDGIVRAIGRDDGKKDRR